MYDGDIAVRQTENRFNLYTSAITQLRFAIAWACPGFGFCYLVDNFGTKCWNETNQKWKMVFPWDLYYNNPSFNQAIAVGMVYKSDG